MLKGLGFLALRALPLMLLAAPAWAGSTLYINSQAGDTVGGGQQVVYTDSDGPFSISGTPSAGIDVFFQHLNAGPTWILRFVPPSGRSLTTGNFDHIERWPAIGPLDPGLAVTTNGNTCGTAIGRFVVRAITTDGSGNFTSLAVDFEQHCNGAASALLGAIRYNSSIPYPVDAPTADAGQNQIVAQGTTVSVDGSLSEPGNGSVTGYTWTQLSGPTIAFADASAVSTTFTAPAVSAGGADVVLQLEVDNSLSLSSTSTVTIHVANPADPVTQLSMTSDPGDVVLKGQTLSLNADQAAFTVTSNSGAQGVRIVVNAGPTADVPLVFEAPLGQTLQVGTYDGAEEPTVGPSSAPGISVNSGGCTYVTGRFVILDLQKDIHGNITSFAADFEQHCGEVLPALRGTIRYNSTVPVDAPLADAGSLQTMVQGETVTLDGSTWSPGGDGDDITSYQWVQVSGPAVTLSDPNAADPTFTAPDVLSGGSDLVFQLTVTNSLGFTNISTVTVHVAFPTDATTLLHTETTPGGLVTESESMTITPAQQPFTPSTGSGGVKVQVGGVSLFYDWVVSLVPPTGTPLQVGSYNAAQPITNRLAIFPGFSLGGGAFPGYASATGFICTGTVSSRFVILAIQTDGSGNPLSLAADFDQTCSNSPTTMHGVLRYNSSVPVDAPEADAGGRQELTQGALVTLPGTTSYSGSVTETIASYQWTQLSGPSVALSDPTAVSPTFTAPTVPLGGADLVFQLAVTNSNGISSVDDVTVHVFNPADPHTLLHIQSDPGDPIGQGQTIDLDDMHAIFATQNPALGGDGKLISATYSNVPLSQWVMIFGAPFEKALSAGPYDQAQIYGQQALAQPGLYVSDEVNDSFKGCAALAGSFDILDIQTDQSGIVTSLAADFTLTCTGATGGLHGKLRYNSAVPLNVPYADAGVSQLADPGSVITLGGSNSDAGADGATISSYQWVQVSGPNVTLSDPSGATTTFTSPNVPLGGADLVFQLTITNSDGVSSTSTVTIHVGNLHDAKTRLYIASDPDDPIGQGQTYDLTLNNTVFGISALSSNNVANNTIRFTATTAANNWSLDLAAPAGQALTAGGHYLAAQTYPFQEAPAPGLAVSPGFNACDSATGLFVVRDLQIAQDGSVMSFAADFVQHCFDEPPAVTGFIRYNSTVPLDTAIADAGPDQYTYSGLMPVTLDASATRVGPGGTLSYAWTQIVAKGDPVVTLSDPTAVKPVFLTPDVPAGGRTLTFQLTASTQDFSDIATMHVTVGNETDAKSAFYYESDPGDTIGQGSNGFGAAPAISVTPNFEGEVIAAFGVSGAALPDAFNAWSFSFQAADDAFLQPGIYRVVPGSLILPTMLVTSLGPNCTSPTGLFIVRDIAYTAQGNIANMGVDFVQHCAGATGDLRGALRYNSKTPILINEPTADPGPNQAVTQAGNVTLDGSASFPGWGTIISSQWKQVGGPRVTLANANTATASFNLPATLLANGGSTLVFQLMVKNSLGLSSSGNITIRAQLPTGVSLGLQSDPGDPVGGGQTVTYSFPNTAVKLQSQAKLGVSAILVGGGDWTLDFVGPIKRGLEVGTYSNATLFQRSPGNTPLMDVSTASVKCKTVTGSFTVLDVVYGGSNKVDSLAVDFVQHCNGIGPALHGKFRYHSAVP